MPLSKTARKSSHAQIPESRSEITLVQGTCRTQGVKLFLASSTTRRRSEISTLLSSQSESVCKAVNRPKQSVVIGAMHAFA